MLEPLFSAFQSCLTADATLDALEFQVGGASMHAWFPSPGAARGRSVGPCRRVEPPERESAVSQAYMDWRESLECGLAAALLIIGRSGVSSTT